jgi:hypothetical protein
VHSVPPASTLKAAQPNLAQANMLVDTRTK